jgi:hypothetical protein
MQKKRFLSNAFDSRAEAYHAPANKIQLYSYNYDFNNSFSYNYNCIYFHLQQLINLHTSTTTSTTPSTDNYKIDAALLTGWAKKPERF